MSENYWVVIPAAGIGSRMGAGIPKQYLGLGEKTVIEHTLDRFTEHPKISGVYVAIAEADSWWLGLPCSQNEIITVVPGGNERANSVLNALQALADVAQDEDWVLVHDAARPCIRNEDLDLLIEIVGNHPIGGLLGVPVKDTMKRTDSKGIVDITVDRQNLWHAYTPQMFRLRKLKEAMQEALTGGISVTDEASAIEFAGFQPIMVKGHADNIKITEPGDLGLAEFYLQKYGKE